MAESKTSGRKNTKSGRAKPLVPRAGLRVDKHRYDGGGKLHK